MKKVGLFLAALLTLTGEGTDPVRHLEYAFAIYPTAKPNGGLFDGTLSVDILGTAPDGGMWVQASEWWYYTLRPRQTRQCEVFPGGSVRCDDVPPYPSETELVLFPLLASGFFGGGSSNGASSWQHNFKLSFAKGLYVTAVSLDLTATPQSDGRTSIVRSTGVFVQLDRRRQKAREEGRFVYDRAASLPVVVHEVRSPMPTGSVYSQTAVDLQLTKDSAGTSVPAPSPRFQNKQRPPNGLPNVPLSAPLPKASEVP
jgi:hypothetical protein